jgi:hypothetical protein
LCEDAKKKLPDAWVVLRMQDNFLAVGLIDDNLDVGIKVIFEGNYIPTVLRYGLCFLKICIGYVHNSSHRIL